MFPKVDLSQLPEYYRREVLDKNSDESIEDTIAIIESIEEKYGRDFLEKKGDINANIPPIL